MWLVLKVNLLPVTVAVHRLSTESSLVLFPLYVEVKDMINVLSGQVSSIL